LTEMLVQHEGLRLSRRTVQRLLLFLSRDQRGTDRYPRGRRRRYAPNPARPMASSRSNPVTTVWDWWVDRVASAETAAIPSTTNAKTMPSSHQRFIAVILTPSSVPRERDAMKGGGCSERGDLVQARVRQPVEVRSG